MGMRSTSVLQNAMLSLHGCMPCICVIFVVTSTSMQSSLLNDTDFRDLEFHCLCLLLFGCHVNLMLPRDPCIFWRCSVRMFCSYSFNRSIPALVCNYVCHSMTQSCSTFAIKYFWQILIMICNLAKLVVVVSYLLCT